jgi:potassium-dependent mechanosensitive channel
MPRQYLQNPLIQTKLNRPTVLGNWVQRPVAYGTNPEEVIEILMKVAQSHPDVLANPAPQAVFKGFGDSSLDFELRVWTQNTDRGWQGAIQSDLSVAINRALAEKGIEIPFPQRDLHLRSISPEARAEINGVKSSPPADAPRNKEKE